MPVIEKQKLISSCNSTNYQSFVVPGTGLEPAQPCDHWSLKPARLPISPSGQYKIRCFSYEEMILKKMILVGTDCKSRNISPKAVIKTAFS